MVGGVWGQNICYHVSAFVILFDMQSDHVLKKLNFDLLIPGSGDGGKRGFVGKIFAFMIPLNLICKMIMF